VLKSASACGVGIASTAASVRRIAAWLRAMLGPNKAPRSARYEPDRGPSVVVENQILVADRIHVYHPRVRAPTQLAHRAKIACLQRLCPATASPRCVRATALHDDAARTPSVRARSCAPARFRCRGRISALRAWRSGPGAASTASGNRIVAVIGFRQRALAVSAPAQLLQCRIHADRCSRSRTPRGIEVAQMPVGIEKRLLYASSAIALSPVIARRHEQRTRVRIDQTSKRNRIALAGPGYPARLHRQSWGIGCTQTRFGLARRCLRRSAVTGTTPCSATVPGGPPPDRDVLAGIPDTHAQRPIGHAPAITRAPD